MAGLLGEGRAEREGFLQTPGPAPALRPGAAVLQAVLADALAVTVQLRGDQLLGLHPSQGPRLLTRLKTSI